MPTVGAIGALPPLTPSPPYGGEGAIGADIWYTNKRFKGVRRRYLAYKQEVQETMCIRRLRRHYPSFFTGG
jgi:hypothetical protein